MIDFNMTIKVTNIVYDTTDNEEEYLDMDLPTELVFDIDGDSVFRLKHLWFLSYGRR